MSEAQVHAPRIHRRINGVTTLGPRKEDSAIKDACWVCEGWREVRFEWTPGVSGSMRSAPVFLHLSFDDFRPMVMEFQDGRFVLERMCPPSCIVEYFFTNPFSEIQCFARDQKTHESQPHSRIRNFGVPMKYSDGTCLESKPMGVLNVVRTGPAQTVIDARRHYVSTVTCKPREAETICDLDQLKAQQRIWSIDNSFFKDFDPDNTIRMSECLDQDLSAMKVGRTIVEDQALRAVLLNRYASYLNLYYYYSSFAPNYEFPRINQVSVQEFIEQSQIVQRGLMKNVDVDICFISSHVIMKRKDSFFFTEERSLVRHQFLEFIIRIAREAYLRNKIGNSLAEAVDTLIAEHTASLPPTQEWRNERYWTQIMDITIKYKMPIIKALFNASKEPRVKFISPEAFIDVLKKCGFITAQFTEQEAYMIYQQSMMTQIDTLNSHRHCQMALVEFCEGLARVAEKLSPSSPSYKEKNLKRAQRRILPLFVKFEGILFLMYHLLDLKSVIADKQLITSSIVNTRQARKLGVKADSDSDEEEPQRGRSATSQHKDHSQIFQRLIQAVSDEDDDELSQGSSVHIDSQGRQGFKRKGSRQLSSEIIPSSQPKTPTDKNWSKLQQAARAQSFKKSLTQFTPANLVTKMASYALQADMEERAEYEESSPLTKAAMRKSQVKRSQFNQGLTLKPAKFQFDEEL